MELQDYDENDEISLDTYTEFVFVLDNIYGVLLIVWIFKLSWLIDILSQ